METEKISNAQKVVEILKDFEKNTKDYDNSPAKELIMERKDIADKEKSLAKEIIIFQDDIEKKMMGFSTELLKLKGIREYIDNKILVVITPKTKTKLPQ